jgi:hypothetical protein
MDGQGPRKKDCINTQLSKPYSELCIGFTWPQNMFLMATEILC